MQIGWRGAREAPPIDKEIIMSMHMIRGVQVHGNRRKVKRKPGWKEAMAHHEAFLKKMGVKGKASDCRSEIPSYRNDGDSGVKTSDAIPGTCPKGKSNQYTGDYIIGIGTMHKSNSVPVTRKKDAEAMAKMRR